MAKLGRSELSRIGKWRAFMKGRKIWTNTDEEILRIILDLNDKSIVSNEKNKNGKFMLYRITISRDGVVKEIGKEELSPYWVKKASMKRYRIWEKENLEMWVIANDEKYAIKIVNERRIQLIVENKWSWK